MSVEPFVSRNVDAFLDLFQRVRTRAGGGALRFRTWVDCETGQLCFAEEGRSFPCLQSKQWRLLDLTCVYDARSDRIHLEEEKESVEGLKPLAQRIVQESREALRQLEGATPWVARVTDHVLLSKAWYPLDREGAERLLKGKPIGTYLFRKDGFASILEERLREERMIKKLSLLTLTVLFPRSKCTDFTLVHPGEGWQIYKDDLFLEQETFTSLVQLVLSLKRACRYPLYR